MAFSYCEMSRHQKVIYFGTIQLDYRSKFFLVSFINLHLLFNLSWLKGWGGAVREKGPIIARKNAIIKVCKIPGDIPEIDP